MNAGIESLVEAYTGVRRVSSELKMGGPQRESELEALVFQIGTELLAVAASAKPSLFDGRGLRGKVFAKVLEDEQTRAALFRFIDALPQLQSGAEVATHFRAYLGGLSLGGIWGRLFKLAETSLLAPAVRASVERLARSFLVEETQGEIARVSRRLSRIPASATFDAVGEAVLTETEADRYLKRNLDLLDWIARDASALPNLSIKLSALTPRFDPIDPAGSRSRALTRLRQLMPRVQAAGATLTVDMEHHDFKPLVLETFVAMLEEYSGGNWIPGIAVQAYLRSARDDLAHIIATANRLQRRVCIRLVKGAYWDTEVATALQRDWPVPVFCDKAHTDSQYEELVGMLFDAGERVYPAIASHNVRSLAYSMALARLRGRPAASWEIQMLLGMAEPLAEAVVRSGAQLRIYAPTGDLISGIAYLVRRLVENTANTSVLRQTWIEPPDPQALLSQPRVTAAADRCPALEAGFSNTPLLDFSEQRVRNAFSDALTQVRSRFGETYRLRVRGAERANLQIHESVDPADPAQLLGRIEQGTRAQAAQAVENARTAMEGWRDVSAHERAARMVAAADLMQERRCTLAAWQVFEIGKNWREADADVAEAIDFLRYYALRMRELGDWQTTRSFPGERNETRFEPRGVAAVIAPWNFPLAILAGMASAALVTGNSVIMKPARPSQIIAHQLASIFHDSGIPLDVCQLVTGPGDEVGNFLVDHPLVSTIAFTGSRSVGFDILRRCGEMRPGQRMVKRVVCEMGGKNAIIVDRDADLDEGVSETLASAFGYQGQKCSAASRVIVVNGVYERFITRLAEALDAYSYGPPADPRNIFGPVVSADAKAKIDRWIEIGESEARLFYRGNAPQAGFFVAPAIFSEVSPDARIAREEIFGPVIAVIRSESFEQAIELAIDSDYALTGGVFSRLPDHIELARRRFRVGDLYINRRTTGARVGVQPFGGIGHSGTGVQAGGPDYLKQFMWSRTYTENTLRHGYVPPQQ